MLVGRPGAVLNAERRAPKAADIVYVVKEWSAAGGL